MDINWYSIESGDGVKKIGDGSPVHLLKQILDRRTVPTRQISKSLTHRHSVVVVSNWLSIKQ